ncbi:MAG: biotin--[acetyl-CoA-carboxylase] ligase [Sulfobacillus acidophilus]|uniref:biotin--[biotin carboxyl-carrier protein] ligase n=1 Tax=Sulfobacillus acidophilus TaxID=53633 RepID=A0A2T2WGD8_9FIRM|nr:MAG: biotin--[acetyl-CoA-carboxylase] ligase [Sulfobacillus acidophilus]
MTRLSHRMQHIQSELSSKWCGHPTVVLEVVPSTNRWLKEEWALGRIDHGTAVWADGQTDGRGRLGRQWDSPSGENIYTSVLVTPPPTRVGGIVSLLAGVAVVQAVRAATGLDARLKWPNDVLIYGKKFSGILVEAGMYPRPWVVIGIGINVGGTVDQEEAHRVTLERVLDHPLSREDLWITLIERLEDVYEAWLACGDQWVVQAWTAANATLGKQVRVERPGHRPWVGLAERIDDDGGLWVTNPERREKVISGDVRIRAADGSYAPDSS